LAVMGKDVDTLLWIALESGCRSAFLHRISSWQGCALPASRGGKLLHKDGIGFSKAGNRQLARCGFFHQKRAAIGGLRHDRQRVVLFVAELHGGDPIVSVNAVHAHAKEQRASDPLERLAHRAFKPCFHEILVPEHQLELDKFKRRGGTGFFHNRSCHRLPYATPQTLNRQKCINTPESSIRRCLWPIRGGAPTARGAKSTPGGYRLLCRFPIGF